MFIRGQMNGADVSKCTCLWLLRVRYRVFGILETHGFRPYGAICVNSAHVVGRFRLTANWRLSAWLVRPSSVPGVNADYSVSMPTVHTY